MATSGSFGAAPYAAWLRVYEPVHAFAEPDHSHWVFHATDPDRAGRVQLLVEEHAAAVRRAIAVPLRIGPEHDLGRAFVLTAAETGAEAPLVCPLDERLRSWQALESLGEEIPEPLLSAFVPPSVAQAALRDYTEWRQAHAQRQPHILTSTWHVPLWWFAAFAPQERLITLEPAAERALLYRTPMYQARTRMAQALDVLRRSMGDGVVTDGVEQVARWLEEFHPHSYVELDYGGLASLVDDDTLRDDVSVADVVAGLAALRAGEADGAEAAYARLVDRWRDVQALEHAT